MECKETQMIVRRVHYSGRRVMEDHAATAAYIIISVQRAPTKQGFSVFILIHVLKRFLGSKRIKHIDSKGQEEESNLQFALKHVKNP